MADRNLLQKSEAVDEDQNFRGNQRKGGPDADLDRADRDVAAAMVTAACALQLVAFQLGGAVAPTVVRAS